MKVEVEEFVDDYERPVLEKYEKITPTPLEKKKKVHISQYTLHVKHLYRPCLLVNLAVNIIILKFIKT